MKTINPQSKEAQQAQSTTNIKNTPPRCIITKYLKASDKDKNLKTARNKNGRLHAEEQK